MALSATVSPEPYRRHKSSAYESEEFIIYSSEEPPESHTATPVIDDAEDMKYDSNPSHHTIPNRQKPKTPSHPPPAPPISKSSKSPNDTNHRLHSASIHTLSIEQLTRSLTVPLESRRVITITKTEERHQSKRLSTKKYTVYTIECDPPIIDGVNLTVCRRYNDFKWLRSILIKCFPAIYIPPIPPQQIMGRFKGSVVDRRKRDLQRFLNRLASVQCISESLIFTVFLSRPEDTFPVSKEEMERNHIPTINQKIHFLESLFPTLNSKNSPMVTQYHKSNVIDIGNDPFRGNAEIEKYIKSADAVIFSAEIGKCHDFMRRVRDQLGVLEQIGHRINDQLVTLKRCSKRFHESFWTLHCKTNALSDQCSVSGRDELDRFGSDQRDFYSWFTFNNSMHEMHHDTLCRNIKYQYDDINAFMDLFEDRNKLCIRLESVKSRNVHWNKMIDLNYELQPHQMTQITMDFKEEKVLRRLLLLMTTVILKYDVQSVWGQLIKEWQSMMKEYAQKQLMAHQMLYAEVCAGEEEEEEEEASLSILADAEEYEYEPVFDDNDSRRFSYHHVEKSGNDDNNEDKVGISRLVSALSF